MNRWSLSCDVIPAFAGAEMKADPQSFLSCRVAEWKGVLFFFLSARIHPLQSLDPDAMRLLSFFYF